MPFSGVAGNLEAKEHRIFPNFDVISHAAILNGTVFRLLRGSFLSVASVSLFSPAQYHESSCKCSPRAEARRLCLLVKRLEREQSWGSSDAGG